MLLDRLSERKPSSFAELDWVPASCLDRDDAMALPNVVLLFSTQKEVRRRVFPRILSSDNLTGVKLHFSLGRALSAHCLSLRIYLQINIHTSDMGHEWNKNVRFETVAEEINLVGCDAVRSIRYARTDMSQEPDVPIVWVHY